MFFHVKPDIIRGQTAKDGNQVDYWAPTQKQLLNPDLLKKLKNYKKDEIEDSLVTAMQPIFDD